MPVKAPPIRLTIPQFCGNIWLVVLDGELAVPCTRKPPKRGRIPPRGLRGARDCQVKRRRRLGPARQKLVNPARSGRKQR
jgi:hypothetical protein